LKTILSRI